MTDLLSATSGTNSTPPDVEQLRHRINELEQQLLARTEAAGGQGIAAASGPSLKVVVPLAAATTLMAFPAFLTVRRWYRWWR